MGTRSRQRLGNRPSSGASATSARCHHRGHLKRNQGGPLAEQGHRCPDARSLLSGQVYRPDCSLGGTGASEPLSRLSFFPSIGRAKSYATFGIGSGDGWRRRAMAAVIVQLPTTNVLTGRTDPVQWEALSACRIPPPFRTGQGVGPWHSCRAWKRPVRARQDWIHDFSRLYAILWASFENVKARNPTIGILVRLPCRRC